MTPPTSRPSPAWMAVAVALLILTQNDCCRPCAASRGSVLPAGRRLAQSSSSAVIGDVVTAQLTEAIDASGFGGVSVYIGTSMQGEMFNHSKGDSAPSPTTATPVASASKWVSGLMLMSLVQEGTLTLETQASDLLDYWSSEGTKGNVTLHHLMSFTSGFMSLSNSTCLFSMPFIGTQACAREVYEAYEEPLQFEPGTHFGYSNEQLEIAAAMAEVATGVSWEELYEGLVVEPLMLQDGGGYQGFGGVAGSLNISARDYASILTQRVMSDPAEAQPSPGDLVPESIALMNTDHTSEPEVTTNVNKTFPVTIDPSWPEWHYGYAHWIECPESYPVWSPECSAGATEGVHSSIGAFGFYPIVDFRAREGLAMSEALYIVIAPEVSFGNMAGMVMSLELANGLRGILDEAFPLLPSPAEPEGSDDSDDSSSHRSAAVGCWVWLATAVLAVSHVVNLRP